MNVRIKVGDWYFHDFISEIKGNTGHTQLGTTTDIKSVRIAREPKVFDSISGKGIVVDLIELMRFGDIPIKNIIIEVDEC
jgi:hypothetical protein